MKDDWLAVTLLCQTSFYRQTPLFLFEIFYFLVAALTVLILFVVLSGYGGCESADCDYVFYYSDTLEPLSIKNSVISVTSLDSGYGDYPGVGWNHEGVVLPEKVSQVYRSQDCVVAIDQTLSLRNTYAHACFGNSGIANSASSEYDAGNVQKHGISWLCPDDSVKFKALTPIGSCGFGLYTQPMTNATPNNPRKSYTIK